MELSIPQVLLVIFDISMEAIWPLTLMITLKDGEYPYDPFVMQSLAVAVAFFYCIGLECYQSRKILSFYIGWERLFKGFFSAFLMVTGLMLMTVGFKTASSGAAATSGFLALPIYVVIESISATLRHDLQDWQEIEAKLSGVTIEVLLIITTCATLFILKDKASAPEGIFLLLLGRFCICLKSYLNGRSVGLEFEGEFSDATIWLGVNSFLMYILSQPASLLLHGYADRADMIPHGWNAWTLLPFFTMAFIFTSNVTVETTISGEMQAIDGMSGRLIGMYISFCYDVVPTSAIVLAVITISLAVTAYMRMHYGFGGEDLKLSYYILQGRKYPPHLCQTF